MPPLPISYLEVGIVLVVMSATILPLLGTMLYRMGLSWPGYTWVTGGRGGQCGTGGRSVPGLDSKAEALVVEWMLWNSREKTL